MSKTMKHYEAMNPCLVEFKLHPKTTKKTSKKQWNCPPTWPSAEVFKWTSSRLRPWTFFWLLFLLLKQQEYHVTNMTGVEDIQNASKIRVTVRALRVCWTSCPRRPAVAMLRNTRPDGVNTSHLLKNFASILWIPLARRQIQKLCQGVFIGSDTGMHGKGKDMQGC